MDKPFVYDNYVTGRAFVGRKYDCTILGNLLEAREHVVMYEPPKTGKMSLIQQTLFNMRASAKQFMVIHVNMFNVRTIEDFLVKFGPAEERLGQCDWLDLDLIGLQNHFLGNVSDDLPVDSTAGKLYGKLTPSLLFGE